MPNNNDDGRIISIRAGYMDPVTGEFKRDLFWERVGAENGDPEAMIKLGTAYLTGDGVERDPVKAVEYYRRAAEMDEPVGQYNMGIQCARGEGIKRDFAAAISWMEQARDNGDADAVTQLKILRDAPEIERKAYAGDAEAQARFSTLLANYSSKENVKESVEMARRSVEQGCPRGYHCLGTRYDYGMGVEKDPVKAADLYRQGAELGSPECQYSYAVCFKQGSGVQQSDETALRWAVKAAEQGHAAAAASISLESGSHPQPIMPVETILGYLLKAEEKEPGDVRVAAQLGVQYINLDPSDYEKSIYWYERAAELGDENAGHMAHVYRYRRKLIDEGKLPENIDVMSYIGYLKANNLMAEAFGEKPLKKEPEYDIDEVLRGVEDEDPDSIKQYAYACFVEGEEIYDHGIDKDRAMSLLESLSETDPEAAGIIGLLYLHGNGLKKDEELAAEWLNKAVDGGESGFEDALETALESVQDLNGPMPDYEIRLTDTKKGDRKERSELVKVGDTVSIAINEDGSKIDFSTRAGDVGEISSNSWLKQILAENIPYHAEIISSVPYSKLKSKRMNPVIEVRLHINATKMEMKKQLGWDFIPNGIYGNGKYFTDTPLENGMSTPQVHDQEHRTDAWLEEYGEYLEENPCIDFAGTVFVLSGVYMEKRDEITQKIVSRGGVVRSSVSGKTDYLVCEPGESGDSKVNSVLALREKGKSVKIILMEDLMKALDMGQNPECEKMQDELLTGVAVKREKEETDGKEIEQKREEAEQKMLTEVDSALARARKAGAKYEVRAMRIEQTVSRTTINLSSQSSLDSLRSIVKDCASACDELYLVYQDLVRELDSGLRGLLSSMPGAFAIRSVAGTIAWLNEESRIQNNYAAQFEGIDLGQLVKKEYLPRPENLDIERFWKTKYDEQTEKKDAESRWSEKLREHKRLASEEEHKARDDSRAAEQETRDLIKNFKKEEKEKVNKAIEEKKKEFQAQYSVVRERMEYCKPAKDLLFFRAFNYGYVTKSGAPRINYDENHVGCVVRKMHDLKQIVCLSVGVVGVDKDGRCQLSNISAEDQKKYGLGACTKWKNVKKIAACYSSNQVIGLLEDGHCVATIPSFDVGVHRVSSWSDIVDIICEAYYAVGLREDGTVVINGAGNIPDNLRKLYSDQKDILAIFPYDTWHFAALKADGTILPDIAEMREPAIAAENIVAIAKNTNGPVFLQADGTVVATKDHSGGWGGQTKAGYPIKTLKDVVAIFTGEHEFAALCEDGIFWAYDHFRNSIYALNAGLPIFKSYRYYYNEVKKKEREEQERLEKIRQEEQLRADRRANNLCQYCGGKLTKKLFGWKCAECGRKKDY